MSQKALQGVKILDFGWVLAVPLGTKVLGMQTPGNDAQTIRPEAELLFVAGAGWAKKQTDGQLHIKQADLLTVISQHQFPVICEFA